MMKKLSLITFLLLISNFATSDDACVKKYMTPINGGEDWGIGAFKIPENIELSVYLKDYKEYGYLKKNHWTVSLFDLNNRKIKELDLMDMTAVSHISNCFLKVKNWKDDDYFLFGWNSKSQGLLVMKKDLENNNLTTYSYKDLILKDEVTNQHNYTTGGTPIGVNIRKNCLNLREFPTIEGTKLDCIPGNDWDSELKTNLEIKDIQDNWAYVEVVYMKPKKRDCEPEAEWCCDQYPVILRKRGWVQIVDEKGFPNIWFQISYSAY
ncbi:MAG: hypothetical protein RIC35_01690 [Marinoscillum sp.]